MAFWDDGIQLHDIDPFAEGHAFGPPREQSGREPGASAPADSNSYLYGGGGNPRPTAKLDGEIGTPITGTVATEPFGAGIDLYNDQTQGIAGGYGDALSGMGQGLYDYGGRLAGMGEGALGADPNRLLDEHALADARSATGNIGDAGDALMALAARRNGQSVAEAQLRGGVASAAQQNLALANSGRGLGGGAAARRAAMSQNAMLFGRMNPELAALRAQEEQSDLQRRGQAAAAAGGLFGAQTQAALGTGGYQTGALAQGEQLATDRGLGLIGQGVGAAGTGGQVMGQAGQTELQGQQLVGQANEAQLAAQVAKEQNATVRRGQDRGLQGQEMQAETQNKGAWIGAGATVLAELAKSSDRTAKTDIEPVEFDDQHSWVGGSPLKTRKEGDIFLSSPEAERGSASNSWVGGTQLRVRDPETGKLVDAPSGGSQRGLSQAEQFKRSMFGELDDAQREGTNFRETVYPELRQPSMPTPEQAEDTVRSTPAFSFRYKDPERHGEGQRVGVMAQDLEKTPAGANAVFRGPDGKRMVDTGELSTINTAALHGQTKRVDALEEELRKMREQFGFTPPSPDTAALDAGYARERAARP